MASHFLRYAARSLVIVGSLLLAFSPPASYGTDLEPTLITSGQLSDSNQTVQSSRNGLYPESLRDIDGVIYFAGNQSTSGIAHREPCVTRGTYETSFVLKDIYPGTVNGSEPDEFTKAGSVVFFSATDGTNGRELWKTDGTEDGTVLVKNIYPGPTSSNPSHLVECQGKILFAANDGQHGNELWVSDGTDAGTQLVMDIYPGSSGSGIDQMYNWKGVVYFSAQNATNNAELWRSDGTPEGTYQIKDINSNFSSEPSGFTAFKDALYFQAESSGLGAAAQLWKTDGTSNGTMLVATMPTSTNGIGNWTVVGNQLFFTAPEKNHDEELWRSDGTAAGTYLVKNIAQNGGSAPHDLVNYDGALFFVANDGVHGDQIWKSDGTAAGTVMMHEIYNTQASPARPNGLVSFQGLLLFRQTIQAYGTEWWQADGTTADPKPAGNPQPGIYSTSTSGYGSDFLVSGGALYFCAYERSNYQQLWKFTLPLTVTSQPAPQLAAVGASAQFSVAATPSAGVEVQWYKNRAPIPGATGLSYTIAAADLGDAGSYSASLSSPSGAAASEEVVLAVVDRAVPPSRAVAGGSLSFAVKAAGAGLSYQWRREGVDLPTDARIGGRTAAHLTVGRVTGDDEGGYTCEVRLGNLSLSTLPAEASILTKPVLAATAPPDAIISGAFTWTLTASEEPTAYGVYGLPSGLTYNARTGVISGTPNLNGTFPIRVVAVNGAGASAVQTYSLTIAALPPGVAGVFGGLVAREATLNGSMGGQTWITVTRSGLLSGKVVMGLALYPFTGRLQAPLSGSPTASITIARRSQPPLTLHLTFSADTMSGSVDDGSQSADIQARRNVWSPATNPDLEYAGSYNTALSIPAALNGNRAVPQGTGWTQTVVTPSGLAVVVGRLSDGTTVSCTTLLWPDGRLPVFTALYSGHGSINGLQQITVGGSAPAYEESRLTSAGLDWQKTGAASAVDRIYKAGFAPVALTSDGGKWVAQRGINVLFVADAPGNAQLKFSQGGIETSAQFGSIDQTFELTAADMGRFAAGSNPARVSLRVNPGAGLLAGTFVLLDPNPSGGQAIARGVAFSGIMVPHRKEGLGWFLLPGLPDPTTTPATTSRNSDVLSGGFSLKPSP